MAGVANSVAGAGPGSSGGGMGSAMPANNNGANNQTTDYSAQWVKYYRSVGKHEEADALEKQIKVTGNIS